MTNENFTGISTGFTDLDNMLFGFQPSDLILVAARPGMGKTSFALNITADLVAKQNASVAFFTMEKLGKQFRVRFPRVDSNTDSVSSCLIINNTPSFSPSQLRDECMRYKEDTDIRLVIIDYLQLMRGDSPSDSRSREVSDILSSLKELACELQVPIMVLSQLSRSVEKRDDKRPVISDLKDSGNAEQYADVIMFIYRDDCYDRETAAKGIVEINIAKNKNGGTGTVKLKWFPEQGRFANL